MIRALESYAILGIRTIIPFLIDVLKSVQFAKGNTHTNFIEHHFDNWAQGKGDEDLARLAYVADEMAALDTASGAMKERGWPTPWETLGAWRL